MPAEIARYRAREEEELASKRRELAALFADLAERELTLASLKAELATFEGQYLRAVGVLYAELDEWNARIAELIAARDGTTEARAAASQARQQAQKTYASAHGETSEAPAFTASPELKKLFKEVVRCVHPDRAIGEADRILRERLMKEATDAYSRGEMNTLRTILSEYRNSPESVQGIGAAAELQRVILQIGRSSKRIAQIDSEIADLTASPMAKLIAKKEQLRVAGRDLFGEMAADIKRRIDLARQQFEVLSGAEQAYDTGS